MDRFALLARNFGVWALVFAPACHRGHDGPIPQDSAPPGVDSTVVSAPLSGATCPETIYVAQSGIDATDPVPASPDAPFFGLAPEPTRVHMSWAGDPSTTMALLWSTDSTTLASAVELGPDSSYGLSATGASFVLLNGESFGRVHEVHLCGLTPGATYHYRVGGPGHWSADATFTTGPEAGSTAPFRFVVAGDSRDDPGIWTQILAQSDAFAPDFVIFSGDAIVNGADLPSWGTWLDAGNGYLERRPVMAVHGNHEFLAQPFFALFALPTDAGADRTDDEQWFSFDYGDAHFVFLNDTLAPYDTEAAFMDADLAATTRKWKFVSHHQPAYSSCTTHGSNVTLQEQWSPIEEAHGVAFDLAGHNHNYERTVPINGGVQTDIASGTTYVVSGGAGATLYGNNLGNPLTATATVDNNWVLMEVDEEHVTLTAYDLAGNVIDTVQR